MKSLFYAIAQTVPTYAIGMGAVIRHGDFKPVPTITVEIDHASS